MDDRTVTSTAADRGDLDDLLGYRTPESDYLREKAPAYDEIRRRLLRHVFVPEDPALPVKMREIIAAMVAATHGSPLTELHMRRALREGATVGEILEAIQVAERPGGAAFLHVALGHLRKIEASPEP